MNKAIEATAELLRLTAVKQQLTDDVLQSLQTEIDKRDELLKQAADYLVARQLEHDVPEYEKKLSDSINNFLTEQENTL